MDTQSTISAFQKVLVDFRFKQPVDFPEEFAQKRFQKKMELPDSSVEDDRRSRCWDDFIKFDASLPSTLKLLPGSWYKARLIAHEAVKSFKQSNLSITNGSEFTPTFGRNSIESKLSRSSWDCTPGCEDLFLDQIQSERSLRVALKKRFEKMVTKAGLSPGLANKFLWKRVSGMYPNASKKFIVRQIMRIKFLEVRNSVQGSRFSTVRKNNEKNRPINIEPLCNLLVQRTIGIGIRDVLLRHFGIDLLSLAETHRDLVSDLSKATIDLSNASDSVIIALCEFLFPRWFFQLLMQSRSPLILGPDENYHDIVKISSMGNGFTFELMSLILTCIGRTYDCDFSVFGDDIIIDKTQAVDFISAIESVGFVVNKEKSFIDGPFRESCGANFHGDFGYIRSFDFEYPVTIHDCITAYNKAAILAKNYDSFRNLEVALKRCIPLALRGNDCLKDIHNVPGSRESHELSTYFRCGVSDRWKPKVDLRAVDSLRRMYQIPKDQKLGFFYGFSYKCSLVSPTLRSLRGRRHWAKYFMYLHNGGVSKDVRTNEGTWARHLFVQVGHVTIRWRALLDLLAEGEEIVSV